MKAGPDVVRSEICTEKASEFVIETFRMTGVPTFTSPNSIVDGFTTSPGVLVEENGLVSEPQPESPRVNARPARQTATTDPVAYRVELFLL